MANTEGMSDEVLSSLLTPSTTDSVPKSRLATTKARTKPVRKTAALLQRLELPMGERPAATVLRASQRPTKINIPTNPNDQGNTNSSSVNKEREGHDKPQDNDDETKKNTPLILGSIMERHVDSSSWSSKSKRNDGKTTKSQFARDKTRSSQPPTFHGFPSVHMPVGTFVNRSKQQQKQHQIRQVTKLTPPTLTTTPTATKSMSSNITMEDSSRRDAQGMISQMTSEEIKESVEELQAALSPETIAFLKQRAKQRSRPATLPTLQQQQLGDEKINDEIPTLPLGTVDHVIREKERTATLLSSIRTYEELDELYTAEIGTLVENSEAQNENDGDDDWDNACQLLRSTSPRQALWAARVVCQELERRVSSGESYFPLGESSTALLPYPTVLPVSLRCLLDASVTHGFVLHTHVLRSMYALLRLCAHPDHVVDVTCSTDTSASLYQEFFLDDAVPTPPMGSCYPALPAAQPVASTTPDGTNDPVVAYATTSSSTSALQDGEAFGRDPMWTLLSRMRILPRLSQLLQLSSSDNTSKNSTIPLPEEAMVAISGILAMLSVRSPGAASAIAQHPTLLSHFLHRTVMPTDEGPAFFNVKVALPAVVFLCASARQSRFVAASLPVNDFLPCLLAWKTESDEEHAVQKWGLILWRTVLRYGLGLAPLTTFISLAIPHLATARPLKYSLAPEFSSSFANIMHCVKVAMNKREDDVNQSISSEQREILTMAIPWLSTTVRQVVGQCCLSIADNGRLAAEPVENMRLLAGRLRLIHATVVALEQGGERYQEENKWDDDLLLDIPLLLVAMKDILDSGLVDKALRMLPPVQKDRFDCLESIAGVSPRQEATACSFLDSLVSLLSTVTRALDMFRIDDDSGKDEARESLGMLAALLRQSLFDWLECPFDMTPANEGQAQSGRRAWRNKTHAVLCNFLIQELPTASEVNPLYMGPIRSYAFGIVGRLRRGEEATAAILFSNDVLFQPVMAGGENSSSSLLSSLFLKELCATESARRQVDHSFKLQNGFGITADGWGPFATESLLSDAENPGAPPSSSMPSEMLLPVGDLWIWKVLSGTIWHSLDGESGLEDSGMEVSKVIESCLELLIDMETVNRSYTARIPNGAKLYHLLNVMLHPESVLRSEQVSLLTMSLFDVYSTRDKNESRSPDSFLVPSFSKACLEHSQVVRKQQSPESDKLSKKDERLLALFTGVDGVSSRELQALQDFAIDICTVYTEFGAQYEAFTKCIRVFLRAGFPGKVRCEVMYRLRDVLHLLSRPCEEDDRFGNEMISLLEDTLQGDIADNDVMLFRDPPEVLDAICSIIKVDKSSLSRWNVSEGGFFFLFAIASLARSFAASVQSEGSSIKASTRRLAELPSETADAVLEIASRILSQRTENLLVSIVMAVCMEYRLDPHRRRHMLVADLNDESWKTIIENMRSSVL